MQRLRLRPGGAAMWLVALVLGLAGASSARADTDLAGDWSLSGKNTTGSYTGTATFTHTTTGYSARLTFTYASGSSSSATFAGTLSGSSLSGTRKAKKLKPSSTYKGVVATYQLSSDGSQLVGSYPGAQETFSRVVANPTTPPATGPATSGKAKASLLLDCDRDGQLGPADATAASQGKTALLTLVPGKADPVRAPLHVDVTAGTVHLESQPANAVRFTLQGAPAGDLAPGSYDLAVEAVAAGNVDVRLVDGATLVDHAAITVEQEQTYLIIFGYMGEEVTYLESDITKVKNALLPRLQQAGFTVIEDGKTYDQSAIDGRLSDPRLSKKVIVDWCTTPQDWGKYFDRGSIRGFFWSSHGFTEPFPGCPDSELETFESREWTCTSGDPSNTGEKHFVREWKAKLDANAYAKLDFAVFHACCTGGIGDYAKECWAHCDSTTLSRAQTKFGTLPDVSALTFTTHESLRARYDFLQTFDGSAYFGLADVKWTDLKSALAPGSAP